MTKRSDEYSYFQAFPPYSNPAFFVFRATISCRNLWRPEPTRPINAYVRPQHGPQISLQIPLSIPKIQSEMLRLCSRPACSSLPRTTRFCLSRFHAGSPSKYGPATSTRIICLLSGYYGLHFNQSLLCHSQIAMMQSANLWERDDFASR